MFYLDKYIYIILFYSILVIHVIESKSLDPRLARRLPDLLDETITNEMVEAKYISLPLGVWGGRLGVMFRDDVHALIESMQIDVADLKENGQVRSDGELDYKLDIMDHELDANRAFMNLHLMLIQK
jgi:hypothetical protein